MASVLLGVCVNNGPLTALQCSRQHCITGCGTHVSVRMCRETDDEEGGGDGSEGGSDDVEGEKPLTRGQIIKQAVGMLLVGTAACAFFSDPMVDAVTNFSRVRTGSVRQQ